jgi:PKD repeat protein
MTVADFLWDFGDGSTGSGPMPTHAYSAPGSYTVSLTVVYSGGAQVTCTETQVVNTPPQCLAMPAAQTVSLGAPAVLGSTSIDPDGTIVSTDWDFGDGNTASGTLVAHVYAAAGTYLVTLTVTDDGGASSTCTASVTVLR